MTSHPPGTDRRPGTGPQRPGTGPRLKPTNPASLIVAALAAAAVGWIVIANDYGDFPTITWLPTIITGGLGVLEIIAAIATKARIDRRPGTMPVEPLTVVRYVVLAKASSLVGALFGGFFAAVTIWLLVSRGRLSAASGDLPPALGGFCGAVLLLVGALLLERACRVPPQPDEDDETQ